MRSGNGREEAGDGIGEQVTKLDGASARKMVQKRLRKYVKHWAQSNSSQGWKCCTVPRADHWKAPNSPAVGCYPRASQGQEYPPGHRCRC